MSCSLNSLKRVLHRGLYRGLLWDVKWETIAHMVYISSRKGFPFNRFRAQVYIEKQNGPFGH